MLLFYNFLECYTSPNKIFGQKKIYYSRCCREVKCKYFINSIICDNSRITSFCRANYVVFN